MCGHPSGLHSPSCLFPFVLLSTLRYSCSCVVSVALSFVGVYGLVRIIPSYPVCPNAQCCCVSISIHRHPLSFLALLWLIAIVVVIIIIIIIIIFVFLLSLSLYLLSSNRCLSLTMNKQACCSSPSGLVLLSCDSCLFRNILCVNPQSSLSVSVYLSYCSLFLSMLGLVLFVIPLLSPFS